MSDKTITTKKLVRKPRGDNDKIAAMFLPDHKDLMVGTCPKCGFNPNKKCETQTTNFSVSRTLAADTSGSSNKDEVLAENSSCANMPATVSEVTPQEKTLTTEFTEEELRLRDNFAMHSMGMFFSSFDLNSWDKEKDYYDLKQADKIALLFAKASWDMADAMIKERRARL